MANKMQNDDACIAKWRELIGKFNDLIENEPPAEKIKDKLLEIKKESAISKDLTYRQVDAIYARVDNFLSGTYGKTKTDAQMNAGKVK